MIVIGGGVTGSAAARTLGSRGVETVLFEQYEVGNPSGSSHGATRMFRLAYPQPDYVRLARRALESWRRLEDAAGEPLLVRTGGVYAGPWAEQCGVALAACNVPREWLPPEEAATRFPGLSLDGLDRVLYEEHGGVCLAGRTLAAQVRLAQAAGVSLRIRAEALRFLVDDHGITVRAGEADEVSAPVAVVAAGPWARDLLFELGIDLPLRVAFTQASYFAPRSPGGPVPPGFVEAGASSHGLGSGGYMVPSVEGFELKVADGTPGRTVHQASGPFAVDPEQEARDVAFVRRRLPAYDPEPLRTETCLYTMTPDEDFVLERVGPIVIASACSGHGFKFGPLLGEIVADLATGRDPGIPRERFSAARPALARPGPA